MKCYCTIAHCANILNLECCANSSTSSQIFQYSPTSINIHQQGGQTIPKYRSNNVAIILGNVLQWFKQALTEQKFKTILQQACRFGR